MNPLRESAGAGRLRRYATVLVKAAAVLVLVGALTSAIVATGLDLFNYYWNS